MKYPGKPIEITAKGRGKKWERSRAAAARKVSDNDEYFIQRNGGWFRSAAHGYTTDLTDAGVFLGKDAKGYLSAEGVILVPVTSMLNVIQKQASDHIGKAAALYRLIETY